MLRRLELPLFLGLAAIALPAQSPSPADIEFFEREVRPLFAAHCYVCHSSQAKAVFAGLRLDSSLAVTKGSDTGPVIVPGRPADSRLIKAVRGEGAQRMPPSLKLKDAEIATLVRWVEMGAPWPKEAAPVQTRPAFDLQQRRREHWAWQPLQPTAPPRVNDTRWPIQPIDRFVLAKLEARRVPPAKPADKLTLLRRVTFDLTGIPPSESEIAAFTRDAAPGAYERLVDRLLASPQYGERMARRWMDVIRYSDSHGSEGDPDTPFAWRYRDYLIRSFNEDVPYDQLIREQIAGDLLPQPRLNSAEHLNESRIAVAHFRMVEHGFQPVDPWEDRVKWADNQIDVFSKAFQGLTVSCARCHDHKFDAISQRDYYALFGIFSGLRPSQSAVDDPSVLLKNRDALAQLKPRIKDQLVALWRSDAQSAATAAPPPDAATNKESPYYPLAAKDVDIAAWAEEMRAEFATRERFNAKHFQRAWNLTGPDYTNWPSQGVGAPSQPSGPGQFFITPAGDRAIAGLYPAGVYSHQLSQRHAAVITSPRFKVDTDYISLRMSGGNYSFAQLIIENYSVPRGGIYNLRTTGKRDNMTWETWNTSFWKGFSAYIEFSTLDDVTHYQLDEEDGRQKPAPTPKRDGRSWFGAAEVVFHNGKEKPKPTTSPLPALLTDPLPNSRQQYAAHLNQAVSTAVEAWVAGTLTNAQSDLLDYCVRNNILTTAVDRLPLVAEYRRLENEIATPRRAPGVIEEGGGDHALLIRGDHRKPGDPVPRAYLTALGGERYPDPHTMRLQLAAAVASPDNPLAARVIVNRLWSYAFRRGIVRTVDNFGKLGETPTHPELLDWLARNFIDNDWSIKKTLRLLVTSQAYRMSDVAPAADSSNDLFSHIPLRRLEAEEIRDAILSASGQLNPTMYGPPVPVFYSHDTGATKGDRAKGPLDGNGRRSVYLEIRRNATNPFLEVWDVYKPTSTRGQRDVTTVPAQSLALMNSPFVIEQAAKWAASQPDTATMFLRVFGRLPSAEEKDRAETYRSETSTASLCQALWNMKEFLYVR